MQYSKILGNMWSYIKQYIKLCINMNVSRGLYVHNLYYPFPGGGGALTYILVHQGKERWEKLELKERRRKEIGEKERETQTYVQGRKNWTYEETPRRRNPRRLKKEKDAENG